MVGVRVISCDFEISMSTWDFRRQIKDQHLLNITETDLVIRMTFASIDRLLNNNRR